MLSLLLTVKFYSTGVVLELLCFTIIYQIILFITTSHKTLSEYICMF